ncbi:flowering time control protein FPA [Phalaenopsis equestris]|uniref:flowering time control protein FPA n=1 Tax=Phalaenopsis equestris TaxID=78828 RepID=UPI0009E422F5|nr:flowering time control protein FPA [Phalaenopsis equestris]XP_020583338.1 flowering time control protein FPA [Phalaenopsis equestris]
MGKGVRGRDRPYPEFSPRYGERERRSGWGVAPPSRKLWVGNLSSHITENILSEQFLRFGDIESIAYLPGRSYAYVNFKKEEDAVLAVRALHGSNIAGMPLRIEFAKGDEAYLRHKDDRRSIERDESPLRRDMRNQNFSPERSSDKSKGYRSAEPSEVLWIGFPPSLNVDEIILRRAFSPFGEIEKITSFPGRSYAFVRYRSVVAACRAKEALHGKFLNNPRVNICFARSDMPAVHGKGLANGPFSPHLKPNFLPGSSGKVLEPFHGDESLESPVRDFRRASPPFRFSLLDKVSRDPQALDFTRNKSSQFGAEPEPIFSSTYRSIRSQEFSSDRRTTEDFLGRHRTSPADKIPPSHSLPFERPQRVPPFADSWDIEDRPFPLAKKLKIDFIPDKDLPEYPFSDLEQEKHDSLQNPFHDLPEYHGYNKSLDSVSFSLKGGHDLSRSLNRSHAEIDDTWGSISRLSGGSRTFSSISPKSHRSKPESHKPPPLDEIWKWEGTIAKGGTPVCRARCFPVGKVLDFMLPEFLNCTSRTGLDMLAKHYYQAVSTWVVFFVPESDADIGFYGEFMHYLGEKQRVAVAKLEEKVTLFLVPPSDFSEQVLKVPGKVSISGVILKFQQNVSNISSLQHPLDLTEPKIPSLTQRPNEGLKIHEGTSFTEPNSPDFRSFSHKQNHTASSSGYLTPAIFTPASTRDDSFPYSVSARGEKLRDLHMDGAHDHLQLHNPPFPSTWSSNIPVSCSGMGSFITAPSAPSQPFGQSFSKESFNSRVAPGTDSSGYMPETLASSSAVKFPPPQEIKSQPPSATSRSLQPEQLAHLAALLGNQKQTVEEPHLLKDERGKYSNFSQNPISQHHASMLMYNNSLLPHAHASITPADSSLNSASVEHQTGHGQQLQLQLQGSQPSDVPPVQNVGQQTNQQEQNGSREDTEADPEKRLQATLQLAAALLQQIQQRAKAVD